MEELFEEAKKKEFKVVFGLEAQGHIPTIESELKRRNADFEKDYPEHKGENAMQYSQCCRAKRTVSLPRLRQDNNRVPR